MLGQTGVYLYAKLLWYIAFASTDPYEGLPTSAPPEKNIRLWRRHRKRTACLAGFEVYDTDALAYQLIEVFTGCSYLTPTANILELNFYVSSQIVL
jgi:hypothetical protein